MRISDWSSDVCSSDLIANLIACDMHPVNNMKVLRYLVDELGATEEQKSAWYRHWINEGFHGLEALLVRSGSGKFCVGSQPTIADCCLVPQVANALRMNCPIDEIGRAHGLNSSHYCASRMPSSA